MRFKRREWGIGSLLLLAGLAVVTPRVAGHQDDPAARALRQIEDRWLGSEDNPDTLEVILADDFIHALPMGFITKADQIGFMRSHPRPPSGAPGPKHFEDLRVRVYGDVGIVNGVVVADTGNGGVMRTVFTDVFVRRNGRWQAVNAQETPEARQPPS